VIRTELADGGWLEYEAAFITEPAATDLFDHLINAMAWRQESGRFGPTPRLTAWVADEGVSYAYSGIHHEPNPWTDRLTDLRSRLESRCRALFNSVLINRYRHGRDSMGYHADDEPELGENPIIASISLGATRRFRLRHNRSKASQAIDLEHGSLLVMGGTTQHFWQHALPKTAKIISERINLTFRQTALRRSGLRSTVR
jgi:alkylated DNA repair dioxygenase AlkB